MILTSNPVKYLHLIGAIVPLCALIASGAQAQRPAGAAPSIAVIPARTAPNLRPITPGLADWVERRLAGAGVVVRPGREVRTALKALHRAHAGTRGATTRELLDIAARLDARHAVLIDLAFDSGRIDVLLRVHRVEGGRLEGAGRSASPAAALATSANTAVDQALGILGLNGDGAQPPAPLDIGRLAARSRALELLDGGELARAWSELDGDSSPDAGAIRGEIERAADREGVSQHERARLMAARGEADLAWKRILRESSENLYAANPNARILLTAGEVQLARGKLREAQAYFERSVEVDPGSVDSNIGLAQALAGQNDEAAARRAFERAHELSPSLPRATTLLAEMPSQNRGAMAQAHLRAGVEAGRSIDSAAAKRHFGEAASLDPSLAGQARELAGDVELGLGEYAVASQSYRTAIQRGGATAERKRGLARSLRGLRDTAGAETAYKEALELDRDDSLTLQELGEFYGASNRHGEARQLLERAVELAPQSPEAKLALAKTLHVQGELEQAIPLLEAAQELAGPRSDGLRELAAIQRELKQPEAAQATLEQAVGLNPTSVILRQELAAVYRQRGRADDATRQLELVELLGGSETLQTEQGTMHPLTRAGGSSQHFDALIMSFGLPPAGMNRAVLVGVRESLDWQGQVLDWLLPRTLDLDALASGLGAAIDPHYDRRPTAIGDEYLTALADRLFDFGSRDALNSETIATLNSGLDSDTLFVAAVQRGSMLTPAICGDKKLLHVEIRMLSGSNAAGVSILSNQACLPGDLASWETWNRKAGLAWALLLAMAVFPFARGFGGVTIRVKLADNTRALFSISLTKRPRKVKSKRAAAKEREAKGQFNRRLRSLGRSERRLDQGKDVVFRWVPARKSEYYVTVHGPLYHSISEQLVGDFLEERTVLVSRGKMRCLEFDLRPKDCPVEVAVYWGERAVNGAQIALLGQPSSLRYTSNGSAFLYLPKGQYTIVAGARDRAVERQLKIDSFDSVPMVIDLACESGLAFSDCPDAVNPFLEGNFDAASLALEAAGNPRLSRLMRARAHEQRGEVAEASRALEEAGELTQAAELLANHADSTASASLYEEAGDFTRAAEAHRTSGDMLAAARAYEAAYDFPNAIECYRELGDTETVLTLLEKSSEYFEASKLCVELGEPERAIQNLQRVEMRHPFYGESCRLLAGILGAQGNADYAIEKFDEAARVNGIDSFPIDILENYGSLLERVGRVEDAISVLSAVRRQDLHYMDVNTRIESLKGQLTALDDAATRLARPPKAAEAKAPEPAAGQGDSRYEIIDQIGQGGMGVVYRARDKHLGRVVALKRLPDNLKDHPAAVKFFEREARSAAVLNHPNIVTIYDAGQEEGQYFITMELLEGTSLDAIAKKRGALPPLVVAQLGVQIATGLHFAHRNKIIHRDIKTANLFLTKERIVKIMDFGLAKMVEEVRRGATVIGGTPYYMAPEQASGEQVDHRADLYALGITLFQLSTGKLPFSDGDVTYHHRHTPPPDPREFNAELPAAMAELILQLIQKKPEDRIQKAADVVRVLQGMIDSAATRRAKPRG